MTRRKSWTPTQYLLPTLIGGIVFGWWLAQVSAVGSCLFTSPGGLDGPARPMGLIESPALDPGGPPPAPDAT
jgi:hypothetical protein